MRRTLILASLALAACDGETAVDAGMDAGMRDAGMDAGPPGYDGGPITRIPETEAATGRTGCQYARGAFPWQTIGEEFPIGDDIPIDHIIILMQENRSFDHYFGTMNGVDGLPAGASNPDGTGGDVPAFHSDVYCTRDTNHEWNGSHLQYNGGLNDGFVTTNGTDGARAMGYFDATDLPFYYDLAGTFAMSDHHHCSVLGPTWVNRFYMLSATSFGNIDNVVVDTTRVPAEGEHVIFEQLDRVGVSWNVYADAIPFEYGGYPHYALQRNVMPKFLGFERFFEDLDANALPAVSFVEPIWDFVLHVNANDEHPPADPQVGQEWIREIITRVIASESWGRTAIILTYDEHGGFYDHVPPPEACPPGDYPPDLEPGDQPGDFDRYGFRVPLMVISPYSRPGYVSDRVTDHASITRFLQTRFMMPALTGRDANAWPLLDMFDFTTPALMTPPALDDAVVDPTELSECEADFPG